MFRIGQGYDVHKFAGDRDLILGGIKIPFELGLDGHSDADVLTHAVMDALIGALALGDIGKFFPDNDPKFKNADSILLLRKILSVVSEKGYNIDNCIPCCKICNMMKNNLSLDMFLSKVKQIHNKRLESSTTISKESTLQVNGNGNRELLNASR